MAPNGAQQSALLRTGLHDAGMEMNDQIIPKDQAFPPTCSLDSAGKRPVVAAS